MATSGVTTWQLNTGSIISAALRKIAAISKGQTVDTYDTTAGTEALNAMLKSFASEGMPLWAIKEYTFSLTATSDYLIGVGQTLATSAPLKIIQAYITTNGYSIPLTIQTRYDYNNTQPISPNTGRPINLLYQPGNQTGLIRLWPTPDTDAIDDSTITLVYQRPFEDMVASTDTLDFPQNWTEAVIYGLAWRLAPEYGMPLNDRKVLMLEADAFLVKALSFGTEEGSMVFQPDWSGR